jgi:hypothetical protein
MKLYLETPVLRVITKKLGDAISDLDAKIADSPPLALLFGVEKKEIIATPFAPFNSRDIRPFLNKDLIKRTVKTSMKLEERRRQMSSLARAAYGEQEDALEFVAANFLSPAKIVASLKLNQYKRKST